MPAAPLRLLLSPVVVIGGFWLGAVSAYCAGNAHIVDDSEVVEPGTCQLETWVTNAPPIGGFLNVAPACTFSSLPRLELGATFQHFWSEESRNELLGPSIKVNLVPEVTGVGLGLIFNAGVSLRTGDLGLASILVPVSIPLGENARVNLNAGWSYIRSDEARDALFYGAQIETKVGGEVLLMLEAFGRTGGDVGSQVGIRWRPHDGPIDFDFVVGGLFDDLGTRFINIGVTLRR
jgi:hypothetical protein